MIIFLFALAIAGFIAVLMLHGPQRKSPEAASAWSSAVRYSLWTAFLLGALVYFSIMSSMQPGDGPGSAMLLIGGMFLGPILGTLAGVILFPVYYAVVLKKAQKQSGSPASSEPPAALWSPYYPGLVFMIGGLTLCAGNSYHGHDDAWGVFFLCLGLGAFLGPYLKKRGKHVHWAAATAIGALLGVIAYSAVRGIGPAGYPRRKAGEAKTRAGLAKVRVEIEAYARAFSGRYPKDLFEPELRSMFPLPNTLLLPYHNKTNGLHIFKDMKEAFVKNRGHYESGWAYYNGEENPRFFIYCTHTDLNGKVWSSY